MKYSIAGIVRHVGPVETVGNKGFLKRVFTVADGNDKWQNDIPLELHKDATERAPAVGDKVECEFYLQGREWQGRFFLSAKCVDWELVGPKSKTDVPAPTEKPRMADEEQPGDNEDQLPF